MSKNENATQTATQIATYAYDGRRLRNHSLASAERLLSLGSVVAVRKNGQLAYIQFRSNSGANPIVPTAHMGQKYSYLSKVGNHSALRAWAHKDLLQRDQLDNHEDRADAERFIAGVFRNVALSCLVEIPQVSQVQATPAKPASVFSIAEFKAKKRSGGVNRPIEFDSQRRAA